jgi:hypothetical protein
VLKIVFLNGLVNGNPFEGEKTGLAWRDEGLSIIDQPTPSQKTLGCCAVRYRRTLTDIPDLPGSVGVWDRSVVRICRSSRVAR